MDIDKGKPYLSYLDLNRHAIWKRSEEDELHYPILDIMDIPESSFDIKIRANFETPFGREFSGYIVGIKNIFSIVIFIDEHKFHLNKNLLEDCIQSIKKINDLLGKQYNPQDYFPLKYTTTIDLANFKNVSGIFNIFTKRTNTERLDF